MDGRTCKEIRLTESQMKVLSSATPVNKSKQNDKEDFPLAIDTSVESSNISDTISKRLARMEDAEVTEVLGMNRKEFLGLSRERQMSILALSATSGCSTPLSCRENVMIRRMRSIENEKQQTTTSVDICVDGSSDEEEWMRPPPRIPEQKEQVLKKESSMEYEGDDIPPPPPPTPDNKVKKSSMTQGDNKIPPPPPSEDLRDSFQKGRRSSTF